YSQSDMGDLLIYSIRRGELYLLTLAAKCILFFIMSKHDPSAPGCAAGGEACTAVHSLIYKVLIYLQRAVAGYGRHSGCRSGHNPGNTGMAPCKQPGAEHAGYDALAGAHAQGCPHLFHISSPGNHVRGADPIQTGFFDDGQGNGRQTD